MNSDISPAKIVALFLINFDVKKGYEIVWSKTTKPVDLLGVEFKCLPSGIHEFHEDLILFSHKYNDKLYYGLSKFKQNNFIDTTIPDDSNNNNKANIVINTDVSVDRSNVKMYSLGILCEPIETQWEPNKFISNGFEYLHLIDDYLESYFIDFNNRLMEDLYGQLLNMPNNSKNSLVNNLPKLFNYFGPLIFPIIKLSLLRPRIIIFNENKTNNYFLQTFNYLISVLSLIPEDLKIDFQTESCKRFLTPLYNICLNDLNLLDFNQFKNGYIATTNDDILLYQPIYDYGIIISDDNSCPQILSYQDIQDKQMNKNIKASFNDYSKFKIIYELLFHQQHNLPTAQSTDNLSINTSNSIWSNIKWFDNSTSNNNGNVNCEPSWWLKDSTYSISWSQYIWSAFSWFASAGQFSNDKNTNSNDNNTNNSSNTYSATNSSNNLLASNRFNHTHKELNFLQFIEIIGDFHKLIKKWIYLVNEIVADDNDPHLVLTYQDLIDLELDPYNQLDNFFLKQFILLYWDNIKSVEITSGLNIFC